MPITDHIAILPPVKMVTSRSIMTEIANINSVLAGFEPPILNATRFNTMKMKNGNTSVKEKVSPLSTNTAK